MLLTYRQLKIHLIVYIFFYIKIIKIVINYVQACACLYGRQFSSVTQSCPTWLQHTCPSQLPEISQTHVYWVGDAIQPSHPLTSPSPLTFSPSQHQEYFLMSQFFPSGGQNIRVSTTASVIPINIQDWFSLGLTGLISLQSKGLSRIFSNIIVQKHKFFSAQVSSQSNSHIHTWPLEKL